MLVLLSHLRLQVVATVYDTYLVKVDRPLVLGLVLPMVSGILESGNIAPVDEWPAVQSRVLLL